MEMRNTIVGVVAILVAAILLGVLLPNAMGQLYDVQTATNNQGAGYDGNGKAIETDLNVTNDDATIVIWNLFPLFAAIGGMAVLSAFIYKQYY